VVGFNPGEVTKKLKIRSESCGFFYAFVPPVMLCSSNLSVEVESICLFSKNKPT
jgi:hypothetical protein